MKFMWQEIRKNHHSKKLRNGTVEIQLREEKQKNAWLIRFWQGEDIYLESVMVGTELEVKSHLRLFEKLFYLPVKKDSKNA